MMSIKCFLNPICLFKVDFSILEMTRFWLKSRKFSSISEVKLEMNEQKPSVKINVITNSSESRKIVDVSTRAHSKYPIGVLSWKGNLKKIITLSMYVYDLRESIFLIFTLLDKSIGMSLSLRMKYTCTSKVGWLKVLRVVMKFSFR